MRVTLHAETHFADVNATRSMKSVMRSLGDVTCTIDVGKSIDVTFTINEGAVLQCYIPVPYCSFVQVAFRLSV